MRGKHASDEGLDINIPWKKLFLLLFVIIVIVGIVFGGKKLYPIIVSKGWFNFNKTEKVENVAKTKVEKMPEYVEDYKVLGEIKFDKLNYSGYILDSENKKENKSVTANKTTNTTLGNTTVVDNTVVTQENTVAENTPSDVQDGSTATEANKTESSELIKALDKGLVKLYGDKLNQKGNFTIIGHNKEKMFSILQGVSVGEKFSIKTNSNIEKKYIITEILTVEPNDLKSLMPNKDYTQVTLITCATGSDKRLVVKALEDNDYEKSKKQKTAVVNNTVNETNVVEEPKNEIIEGTSINE